MMHIDNSPIFSPHMVLKFKKFQSTFKNKKQTVTKITNFKLSPEPVDKEKDEIVTKRLVNLLSLTFKLFLGGEVKV